MGNIRTYSPYGEPLGFPPLGRGWGWACNMAHIGSPHNPPKGGKAYMANMSYGKYKDL